MTNVGECIATHSASGRIRYEIELRNDYLNKYHVVHGSDAYIVQQKALAHAARWDGLEIKRATTQQAKEESMRMRQEGQVLAEQRTSEAAEQQLALQTILQAALGKHDAIDWESLRDKTSFAVPRPTMQFIEPPQALGLPRQPMRDDAHRMPQITLLDRLIASRMARKIAEAEGKFQSAQRDWHELCVEVQTRNRRLRTEYESRVQQCRKSYDEAVKKWILDRNAFALAQQERNAKVDELERRYSAREKDAIEDYCDLVLSSSQYPDSFPQSYELYFNEQTGMLVVSYQLPALTDIPTLREVKYVPSRNEYVEKHLNEKQLSMRYDDVIYQICLRTIHELFEADAAEALSSIVFNGFVCFVDPATGKHSNPCIISVQVSKTEFSEIHLAKIDPKMCFRRLKGVGSSQLYTITPIPPIVTMDTNDDRFVESYQVVEKVDEGYNLAAMPWEDFEHLIRELFEKEFSSVGGEVKVTRASRDGGVDAVVFDPDPIRGGKIIIQAKRYTSTVSVSAVRDLYGTVMNEGANKGILVTTSDYGPDSYEFARGKPLSLISGSNLLHLLSKHGHAARIDLAEARQKLLETGIHDSSGSR